MQQKADDTAYHNCNNRGDMEQCHRGKAANQNQQCGNVTDIFAAHGVDGFGDKGTYHHPDTGKGMLYRRILGKMRQEGRNHGNDNQRGENNA